MLKEHLNLNHSKIFLNLFNYNKALIKRIVFYSFYIIQLNLKNKSKNVALCKNNNLD